jgi:hypothetical protein
MEEADKKSERKRQENSQIKKRQKIKEGKAMR